MRHNITLDDAADSVFVATCRGERATLDTSRRNYLRRRLLVDDNGLPTMPVLSRFIREEWHG